MSAQAQFEGLLRSFTSDDNDTRNAAEKLYHATLKAQPNQIMTALLQIGRTSLDEELRSMAAILLRRALMPSGEERNLWEILDAPTQTLLKDQLLVGVEKETSSKVRDNFCEAAIIVASEHFKAQKNWDGFIEWLLRLAACETIELRESALQIFACVAPILKDAFKGENFKIILQLLQSGLVSEHLKIQIAALDCTSCFILAFQDRAHRSILQALTPMMLDSIANCLNRNDINNGQEALKVFVELSEKDPGFFKPHVLAVVSAMLSITAAKQLDEALRQLALEFLVSLTENKSSMCRNLQGFSKSLVDTLLQWMLEIPEQDAEEWNEIDEHEREANGDIDNSVIGQEGLDRICEPLGAETIAPLIFAHLPNFLSHASWQYRFVGLMALSMVAEGCKSLLIGQVDKIVQMILPSFTDPEPRVRWAGANAAGQLATDFGPKLQKQYHSILIPKFIPLLEDTANPKVQSHMAAALINFSEKFSAKGIAPYLDVLLQKMMVLIQTPNKMVQEQALTAIASMATCAKEGFEKYYHTFIPLLRQIMTLATSEDQKMMRSKAMECFSLIGMAVGKDVFKTDVAALLDVLGSFNTMDMDPDDPQRDFILETWIRISTCLGDDFVPYLKFVVPPLLHAAGMVAEVQVQDGSVVEAVPEPGWDIMSVGNKTVKFHTVALEEKASACNRLLCFASDMKDGFFPWVEATAQIMLPLFNFTSHDAVRIAAMSTVPHLILSAKLHGEKLSPPQNFHTQLFNYLFPPLLESVRNESDPESLVYALESVQKTINAMGPNSLSQSLVTTLVHDLFLQMTFFVKRNKELMEANPDQDADGNLRAKDEMEEEEDIASELAEFVGALVDSHPQFFMQAFPEILPLVAAMIQDNAVQSEKQLALCIFDDIVEHGKELSFPLWEHFIPFLLKNTQEQHLGLRQASCFGLGVCAQNGGEYFRPIFRSALEAILTSIQKLGSREDEILAPPTENAVSSVGKILKYQTSCFAPSEFEEVMNLWVNWMPLEFDEVEARICHKIFFEMLQSHTAQVLGPNNTNLPRVFTIFASAFAVPSLVEDIKPVHDFFLQFQASLPKQLVDSVVSVLPREIQEALVAGPVPVKN